MKYVYFFGGKKAEGDGSMKDLLGGKGAGLAEMTSIGLPVPAGFTITTECCDYYLKHDLKYPKSLHAEVKKNLARLEKATKKKLGDAKDPLLVSVRSGSARSMPGMMETILNLGLNSKSVEALARNTKNERFAWDAYRRFVQMYSSVVIGLPKEELEEKLRAMKAGAASKMTRRFPRKAGANWWPTTRNTLRRRRGKIFRKIRRSNCGARSAPCSVPGMRRRP